MSDRIYPNTFVYPHRIGGFPFPPPVFETSDINWDYCIIGRFWDAREFSVELVQRLVSRY